ncbi:MAG: dihydroorotate dehydrogenase electron transfer subunit [Erysipelotrichaceae bacterium]
MKIETTKIIAHTLVAKDTYELVLSSSMGAVLTPGQFVNVKVDGFYLRRPISVADYNDTSITLVYKVVGAGTKQLALASVGSEVSIFGPLGKGFPIHEQEEVLLVGGGMGLAPLYNVARMYRDQGTKVVVAYGFLNQEQAYWETRFAALGCDLFPCFQEESNQNVLEALAEKNITSSMVYGCGPHKMLAGLQTMYPTGYISFESRMACAMGVCNGCICHDAKDASVTYKICKEGPVFPFGMIAL